ncbi:MAG TPA: hypothetical protein VNU44_22510 [Bryobacteraceae bacterium]|nr:hypothetical protein [Bryobacteraceae bacterium]
MVGQFAENEPKAAGVVDVGKVLVDFFFAEDRLVFEDVGFERRDAAEAPAGGGQGLDEILFESADRLILLHMGIEKGVEVFLGFTGKGFELGGEAVFEGVLGGSGLAFGSDRSFGFCAVGAGGVGFGLRCHAIEIACGGKEFGGGVGNAMILQGLGAGDRL